jgi:hypothetical protein
MRIGAAPGNASRGARRADKTLTRPRARPYETGRAQVAELVDALVSGTSGASREGSSPFLGTTASRFI